MDCGHWVFKASGDPDVQPAGELLVSSSLLWEASPDECRPVMGSVEIASVSLVIDTFYSLASPAMSVQLDGSRSPKSASFGWGMYKREENRPSHFFKLNSQMSKEMQLLNCH